MVLDVFSIMVIAAVTILLGYIGNAIFKKTKVPDVLWLLIFGLAIGPLFGIVDIDLFVSISPLLSAIALMFILFDAGLNMNFYRMVRQFPRSILMAVLNIGILIVVVGFLWQMVFGDFLIGALLGAIIGGTSSPVIISIVKNLEMEVKSRTFLIVESIITDPLVIIISIAIIKIITLGVIGNPLGDILGSFSIGGMVGIVAGVSWLIVMDKLKGKPFDYILTLSILLLLYVFVETAGGSGAIASLFFGLVLGNGGIFSRFLGLSKRYTVDSMVKSMHTEISFFIRSFFFVFLGMVIVISMSSFALGLGIAVIVITVRFVSSRFVLLKYEVPSFDRGVITHMAARGLAAAIMAEIVISSSIAGTEGFITIVFTVIIATIFYSSIAERFLVKGKEVKQEELKKAIAKGRVRQAKEEENTKATKRRKR